MYSMLFKYDSTHWSLLFLGRMQFVEKSSICPVMSFTLSCISTQDMMLILSLDTFCWVIHILIACICWWLRSYTLYQLCFLSFSSLKFYSPSIHCSCLSFLGMSSFADMSKVSFKMYLFGISGFLQGDFIKTLLLISCFFTHLRSSVLS